jgi:hypothetical protein
MNEFIPGLLHNQWAKAMTSFVTQRWKVSGLLYFALERVHCEDADTTALYQYPSWVNFAGSGE